MRTEMRKNTFWNRERVAKNISYKDLCDLFGGVVSKWGAYFSGQTMPDPLTIRHLCELFDIDIEKGTEEFKKAHALWKSEKHKAKMIHTTGKSERSTNVVKTNDVTVQDTAPQFEEDGPFKESKELAKVLAPTFQIFDPTSELFIGNPKEAPVVDNLDIIKLLYGKLPYELFMAVRSILKHQDGDVLELVYGKVSYKEFRQIQEALKDE